MKRALKSLAALAAAALLGACSLTHLAYSNAALAYSNATPMLTWMVGDYVEMTDGQRALVRDRLLRAFAWHRRQELPEYRRFFERILEESNDTISAAEARTAHRELRGYYHRTLERLLPDLADFLLQLDPEQVNGMQEKFDKDNRKVVREASEGTPQERREKRTKRYLGHIEEFTGRLSDAQRQLVYERVGAMGEFLDERVADRRYRQAQLLALLRSAPTRERAIAELKRLLIDTESWRRPDYLEKLRGRDQQLFEMAQALSNTLTPEQRANFQKRVRGILSDITELTAST